MAGLKYPRKGDKVWVEGHLPQPNGFVLYRTEDEVFVKFYESGDIEDYDLDTFDGTFNERLDQWCVYT